MRALSKKLEHLVETSRELFFRHGIKRVTIEEICRESGVSKMTFYRYFRDKSALAKFIFERIYLEANRDIEAILSQEVSFEARIRAVLEMKLELSKRYSDEFLSDFITGSDPGLRKYLEGKNRESLDLLRQIFLRSQARGEIRSDINVEFLIVMSGKLREAVSDPSLSAIYPDIQALIQDACNLFYYGILTRD